MSATTWTRPAGLALLDEVTDLLGDSPSFAAPVDPDVEEGDYPFHWTALDLVLDSGAKVRVVTDDEECPALQVIAFDRRGCELSRARFTGMAAGTITQVAIDAVMQLVDFEVRGGVR